MSKRERHEACEEDYAGKQNAENLQIEIQHSCFRDYAEKIADKKCNHALK